MTLTDLARRTGLARITIRRYLDAGRFPNAFQDHTSVHKPAPWRVPLSDVLLAGLTICEPDTPPPTKRPAAQAGASPEEVALRIDLAVAEALAEERLRMLHRIEDIVSTLADALADRDRRATTGLTAA